MTVLRTLWIAVTLVTSLANLAAAQTIAETRVVTPAPLSDPEIRALLVDRIDAQHKSLGMVVGIISPQGRHIISYGQMDHGDARPLSGDTVFEIGSITKVFTALLLADMVQRGEVSLSDPVEKYLPAGTKIPERHGRKIALEDLATHTSGLPFSPSDLNPVDPAAYANYTEEQLYRFLSAYELPQDIGSKWQYSNLGFGLLAKALARRAGMTFEALIHRRIAGPLGMESTAATISSNMKTRLVIGHDVQLKPAPPWEAPALPGEGELKSTANDLLTFLSGFLGNKKSPLSPAMAAMLRTRRPGPGGFEQALGWWVVKLAPEDNGFVAFGGQTWGYASTIAYDSKAGVGLVVLSNGTQDDGGLGWHILRPAFPYSTSEAVRARSEKVRKEMPVDARLLDSYAGRYRVASGPTAGDIVTIERQGDALILKSPTAPPQGLRLHAESERSFFLTEADVQVVFQTDAQGRVTGLVFHFAGTDTPAPRIDAAGGNQ